MRTYTHKNGVIFYAETGEEIARIEGVASFKLKKKIAAFAVEKLNAEERDGGLLEPSAKVTGRDDDD